MVDAEVAARFAFRMLIAGLVAGWVVCAASATIGALYYDATHVCTERTDSDD